MIDVNSEELMDLTSARKHPALMNPRTHKPVHASQIHRWVRHGVKAANGDRIRLEVIRTPAGLQTSREAIALFIAKLTNPDHPVSTPRQRRQQQHQAESELTAAGFEVGG
jgi:hypothetical protein